MKTNCTLRIIKSLFMIAMITLSTHPLMTKSDTQTADDRWDGKAHTITNITGIDAKGRKLVDVSDMKKDKYVGLFYFSWHSGDYPKIYDITKLLRDNPEDLWSMDPNNPNSPRRQHYFNEPLYGYYNSADPWVIRKHIELFIAADIDFIAYDFTNSSIHWDPLMTMFELLDEYYQAGWKVPQVMFFTRRACDVIIPQAYEKLYSKNLYSHLWFRGSKDKPYLIAPKEDVPEELHDFFEFRHPFWPSDEYREDGWPYVDIVRPQRLFGNVMSVSIAQHTDGKHGLAFSWSVKDESGWPRESRGRGYTSENPNNGNLEAIESGANFQEQWDHAIKEDPEIIFVTGWNEWAGTKRIDETEKVPYFVDTFNTEFSRDAEMTKSRGYISDKDGNYIEEGYGDNFYMQIVNNVRRYKSIPKTDENAIEPVSMTIDINASPTQWNEVSNVYLSSVTNPIERNFPGRVLRQKYTQALSDNLITEVRTTHDTKNVYFYIVTKEDITQFQSGKTNWMNLFIGIENNNDTSWENYHYVLNRKPSTNVTSLERFTGNGYETEKISDVEYSISGRVMQLKIPKEELGLQENSFSMYFKAADSIEKEDDIMDYYVSGNSVPMGRLSFSYSTKSSVQEKSLNTEKTLALVLYIVATAIIGVCIYLLIKYKRIKNKLCN